MSYGWRGEPLPARQLLMDSRVLASPDDVKLALDVISIGRTEADKSKFRSPLLSSQDRAYYARLIKSCTESKDLKEAKRVHELISSSRHCPNRYLANLLIEMYGKCGSLEDARAVFEGIYWKNVFSWTMMFVAYAQNGHLQEARSVFDKMPLKDVVAWNAMISAYAHHGFVEEAKAMFDEMPKRDGKSWNTMVVAYAQNGHLQKARELFEKVPDKNVVAWTAMIAGYVQDDESEKARDMFDRMPQRDVVSWTAMITSYLQRGDLQEARDLFERMPDRDVVAWTMMIVAYAQKGDVKEARSLFDRMPKRDVVAWNALITTYAQNGNLSEAKSLFDKMPNRDVVSWNALIAAYAQNGHLQEAKVVFDNMPKRNVISWNTMISAYAQNGTLQEAKVMFDCMEEKNAVSWNALLAGYSQHGHFEHVLVMFRQMYLEGMKPDEISFLTAVDACANLTSLTEGRIIHLQIVIAGFLSYTKVGNSLVDMYGKSGCLVEARNLFENMRHRDNVTWSSMIAAYARTGHGEEARHLFRAMDLEGLQPNEIIFICILTACCHAGLVDDAWQYFVLIAGEHGVAPWVDHYGCMVDLLGRAGRLCEAEDLLNSMPFEPDIVTWKALLAACGMHRDSDRGARAAKKIMELNQDDSAPYVLLSNIYSSTKKVAAAVAAADVPEEHPS